MLCFRRVKYQIRTGTTNAQEKKVGGNVTEKFKCHTTYIEGCYLMRLSRGWNCSCHISAPLHRCKHSRFNGLIEPQRRITGRKKPRRLITMGSPAVDPRVNKHMCSPLARQGEKRVPLLLYPAMSVSFQETACYEPVRRDEGCSEASQCKYQELTAKLRELKWCSDSRKEKWSLPFRYHCHDKVTSFLKFSRIIS